MPHWGRCGKIWGGKDDGEDVQSAWEGFRGGRPYGAVSGGGAEEWISSELIYSHCKYI